MVVRSRIGVSNHLSFLLPVIFIVNLAYTQFGLIAAALAAVLGICTVVSNYVTVCRTLEFDPTGCTVKFLEYQRHYTWSELSVKRLDVAEANSHSVHVYTGLFFSPKPCGYNATTSPRLYCVLFHPVSCFWIYFSTSRDPLKAPVLPALYGVDKDAFMEQLRLWNVTLNIEE